MTRIEAERIQTAAMRKRQRQVESEGYDGPWTRVPSIAELTARPDLPLQRVQRISRNALAEILRNR